MADPADKDLYNGLKAAKKKPRNFAIILKGAKVLHLIVQKKPIKVGELQAAKVEFGGNAILRGICQGDGAEMVFQMVGEPGSEPPIKNAQFKEIVAEKTDLKIKPRFEMVAEVAEVDDSEEEMLEGEEEDSSSAETVPPPPPPPPTAKAPSEEAPPAPPPPPEAPAGDALKQLVATMNKLSDGIKSAVAASPDRKAELLQQVAAFQSQIKAADAAGAKTSLLAVGKLIKEMAGGTAPPVSPPPPPPLGPSATTPPVPPPPPPAPGKDPGEAWNKAFQDVEPRYLDALKTISSDAASKLRVVFTYATEQAEAGQFDKALAALKRLEPMLAEALANPTGATPEIAAGTVEKRKFLVTRFQQIPNEIRPEVNKLKASIARDVPDEDSEELAAAIEESLQDFYDELQDEIDKAINAGDMKLINGLKNRVMQNALLAHLSDNPMTDGTKFRESLLTALDEVEQKLAS